MDRLNNYTLQLYMNKKILLLEDDKLLAETLSELLQENGYEVVAVGSGERAADISYEQKFDLYVFDINVPEISGIELLEALRGADDKTPAIFISALVDLNSITKGFAVGGDDYIKKPFFPEELLIRVNAKLGSSQSLFTYADLVYDPSANILKKEGAILTLGEVQERLFKLFIENIGGVLDKEMLYTCLAHPSPTALRVAITKLKQTTGLKIVNLRGVGYTLEQS